MNFAEAALLVQGSACIYSRKVEYLYSLVCQVLEVIGSNKKYVHNYGQECFISNLNRVFCCCIIV
jgi:hypothetical protein